MTAWRALAALTGAWWCLSAPAVAQVQGRALAPCPATVDIRPSDLYGLWHFSLWPADGSEAHAVSRGAMLFEAHPEYPDSVRGQLRRSTASDEVRAHVSGDVNDGEFNLDESEDGMAMSAVWEGTLLPSVCEPDIRGIRRPAEGRGRDPAWHFHLTKVPASR